MSREEPRSTLFCLSCRWDLQLVTAYSSRSSSSIIARKVRLSNNVALNAPQCTSGKRFGLVGSLVGLFVLGSAPSGCTLRGVYLGSLDQTKTIPGISIVFRTSIYMFATHRTVCSTVQYLRTRSMYVVVPWNS